MLLSLQKLGRRCEELTQSFPHVTTLAVHADFSKLDPHVYDDLYQRLQGLDIGVLVRAVCGRCVSSVDVVRCCTGCTVAAQVNNVGTSNTHALYFHEMDAHDAHTIDRILSINVHGTTQLTRRVVKDMVAKHRGAIVFISSGAARLRCGVFDVLDAPRRAARGRGRHRVSLTGMQACHFTPCTVQAKRTSRCLLAVWRRKSHRLACMCSAIRRISLPQRCPGSPISTWLLPCLTRTPLLL